MFDKFSDLVADMLVIYEENTQDGYTDATGVSQLLEVLMGVVPEDRTALMKSFEDAVREKYGQDTHL